MQVFAFNAMILAASGAVLGGYGHQVHATGRPSSGWALTFMGITILAGEALTAAVLGTTLRMLRPGAVTKARQRETQRLVADLLADELLPGMANRYLSAREEQSPPAAGRRWPLRWLARIGRKRPFDGTLHVRSRRAAGRRLSVVHDLRLRRLDQVLSVRIDARLGDAIGATGTVGTATDPPPTMGVRQIRRAERAWRLRPLADRAYNPFDHDELLNLGELGAHLQDLIDDARQAISDRNGRNLALVLEQVATLWATAARWSFLAGGQLADEAEPKFDGLPLRTVVLSQLSSLAFPVRAIVRMGSATGDEDITRAVLIFTSSLGSTAANWRSPWLWEQGRRLTADINEVATELPAQARRRLRQVLISGLGADRSEVDVALFHTVENQLDRVIAAPTDAIGSASEPWPVDSLLWAGSAADALARGLETLGRRLIEDPDAASLDRLLSDAEQDHGVLGPLSSRFHHIDGLVGRATSDQIAAFGTAFAVRRHLGDVLADASRRRRALPLGLLWWALRRIRSAAVSEPDRVSALETVVVVLTRHLLESPTYGVGLPLFVPAWQILLQADHRWAPYSDWELFDAVSGEVHVSSGEELYSAFLFVLAQWTRQTPSVDRVPVRQADVRHLR